MKLTYCRHRFDPTTERQEIGSLKELETPKGKDDAPMWSPCLFSDNSRKEEKAVEVNALVLDFDHGRPAKTMFEGLKVAHIWHTSASHTAEKPKWRLVVPFSEAVSAKGWNAFFLSAVTMFQLSGFDDACKNANRFYFCPPVNCEWEEHKGAPLDPKVVEPQRTDNVSLLRKALLNAKNIDYVLSIRAALTGRPIAQEGSRDSTVTGLGFYLGKAVVTESVSLDSVVTLLKGGFLMPGNESPEHWEGKFRQAFERGRKARTDAAEASTKAQNLTGDWAKTLQTAPRMDGSIIVLSNGFNANIILRNASPWQLRHNLLEDAMEISKDGEDYRAHTDADDVTISNWLQQTYRIKLSDKQVFAQLQEVATSYDPLRVYVDSLPRWDGVERTSQFLTNCLGVEETELTRAYSRKWLTGLIARAMEPGYKFDTVLVLQGGQGIGKSRAVRALCEPWFSDTRIPIGDKDALAQAARFWLHEIAELTSFRRTDQETLKQHFSSPVDSFRPPYGRATITKPRRTVYVGTTNEETFLQDDTGNRRYWCVRCVGKLDLDRIVQDRAQLFAEAKVAYLKGEICYLNDTERALHDDYVGNFESNNTTAGAYSDTLMTWWVSLPVEARPNTLTVPKYVADVLNVPIDRVNHSHMLMGAKALKKSGWRRVRLSDDAGARYWAYTPPDHWFRLPQKKGGKVVDFKVEDGKDLISP